jgi:hypothetical protein
LVGREDGVGHRARAGSRSSQAWARG